MVFWLPHKIRKILILRKAREAVEERKSKRSLFWANSRLPEPVTLAKCSLFRRYAPYKSCHGGKTLPIICENALCVFLLYGRFFLFRKKSRKLNFLRVAHFVRNNKDINKTTGYFRLFILYIRNSLYLKKIVSWYFGYLIKSAKSWFCGKRGKRWKGEKTNGVCFE